MSEQQTSFFHRILHHRAGQVILAAVVSLLVGFLLGYLPARAQREKQERAVSSLRDTAQHLELQALLGSALANASRGSYEAGRQSASEFFAGLQARAASGGGISRSALEPFFAQRDTVITLLARSDPSAATRLAELYVSYRDLSKTTEQQTTMLR